MTIQRFEELDIWKNARLLCKKVRDISVNSPLSKDFSLRDQILRSSGSVMDNIAEGYERDGKKELIQFLYIAKGSLGETRSQLHRCSDANFISDKQYEEFLNDCFNLSAKIKNFINYLSASEFDGEKKRKPR
jgi:four helix bundle protein